MPVHTRYELKILFNLQDLSKSAMNNGKRKTLSLQNSNAKTATQTTLGSFFPKAPASKTGPHLTKPTAAM